MWMWCSVLYLILKNLMKFSVNLIFFLAFYSTFNRRSFVRVLHAVNQFRIDIYLKLADVRGTDPV